MKKPKLKIFRFLLTLALIVVVSLLAGSLLLPTSSRAQTGSPCTGVTCSNHGRCVVINSNPTCACYEGYTPDTVNGLNCLPISVSPPPNTYKSSPRQEAPSTPDAIQHPKTGLWWKRCDVGQNWNGSECTGISAELKFRQARSACPTGNRLPTSKEIKRLYNDKAIFNKIFPYKITGKTFYWTSTPYIAGLYIIDPDIAVLKSDGWGHRGRRRTGRVRCLSPNSP